MKKHKLTAILLIVVSSISFSQVKHKGNVTANIPFQVVNGYFVKNTFTEDNLSKAKITTQKEFDEIFGMAAFMGEKGKPTQINFDKQYIIAVIGKVTDLSTTITPISLKKTSNKIIFRYKKVVGEKQSFTISPLTMIMVDKKYTGKVETINLQTSAKNLANKTSKILNNQWVIEYFNNPARTVESKSCYINIDINTNSFTGNDGCNIANGEVKIKGDFISFGKISRTMMACDNMEQGNVFVKNLSEVNKYKITGGELFLYKNDLLIMTLESFK